jgi:hypothetical protein
MLELTTLGRRFVVKRRRPAGFASMCQTLRHSVSMRVELMAFYWAMGSCVIATVYRCSVSPARTAHASGSQRSNFFFSSYDVIS